MLISLVATINAESVTQGCPEINSTTHPTVKDDVRQYEHTLRKHSF